MRRDLLSVLRVEIRRRLCGLAAAPEALSSALVRLPLLDAPERILAAVVLLALLEGCASRPTGVLSPVADTSPATSRVEMLVATTRGRAAGGTRNDTVLHGDHRVDSAGNCNGRTASKEFGSHGLPRPGVGYSNDDGSVFDVRLRLFKDRFGIETAPLTGRAGRVRNGASFSFRSREATEENHLSRPSLVAKTPDQSDGFATDFCTVAELNFCDNISCFPLSF
jgi:hypothetical protein